MALTGDEKRVIFRMIQEGYLSEEVNDLIRDDDRQARLEIKEFKKQKLEEVERIKPLEQQQVAQVQNRIDERVRLETLLGKV